MDDFDTVEDQNLVAITQPSQQERVPEGRVRGTSRMRGIECLLSTKFPSINSLGNKKEPFPVLFPGCLEGLEPSTSSSTVKHSAIELQAPR